MAFSILPLTPALLLLRLRKPRPSYRQLVRQPGFQAGFAISFAWMAWLTNNAIGIYFDPEERGASFIWFRLSEKAPDILTRTAPFIALTWIATWAVCGRKAEPGRLDRSGRGIGWLWIGLWLVHTALKETGLFDRLIGRSHEW